MLQFLARRTVLIILVTVIIIFAAHLSMIMVKNSDVARPDFNVITHGRTAWKQSQAFLRGTLSGEFDLVQTQNGLMTTDQLLKTAYVNSLGLLLTALAASALLGLVIGTIAALAKNRRFLFGVLAFTLIGISTPSFFAGLLLRNAEILYLRTFGHPLVSVAGFGWDYKHMLLPVLVLSARPLAYLARAAYLSVDRVMEEDYIRTAFSKGLSQARTVNIHALRNIAIPMLTAVGVSLRFSMSALPVVEFLFLWPGMGLGLLEAIDARQPQIVALLGAAIGGTFMVFNLLLDILYKIIDPRMREI